MTRQVIAKVKLNPGKGGYFDPITRIHLTHGDSEKPVFAGMNTTNLRKAVRDKRITITSGSLGDFIPPFKLVKNADGKVVLAPNKVETTIDVKVDKKKKTIHNVDKPVDKSEPKVEEPKETVSVEPVSVETAPELPAVEVTAEENATPIQEEAVTDETEAKTESETEKPSVEDNSSKKNRKKKGKRTEA